VFTNGDAGTRWFPTEQNADHVDGLPREKRDCERRGTTLLRTSHLPPVEAIPLVPHCFDWPSPPYRSMCAAVADQNPARALSPVRQSKPCIKSELHELYPNKG